MKYGNARKNILQVRPYLPLFKIKKKLRHSINFFAKSIYRKNNDKIRSNRSKLIQTEYSGEKRSEHANSFYHAARACCCMIIIYV